QPHACNPDLHPFPTRTLFRSRARALRIAKLRRIARANAHAILASMSTTLIRNGRIVNADRTQDADLLISGEKIQDIAPGLPIETDRKSTRLNSSHVAISYAVL